MNVLLFTPAELRQGLAQKIFYIHVPAAITGLYFSVIPMAIVSGIYLWLKDERLDRIAESLAEVALVFVAVVLCTGPFWGKPIWGTYWQWEARLTSTLFLSFVLIGYLVMRGAIEQPRVACAPFGDHWNHGRLSGAVHSPHGVHVHDPASNADRVDTNVQQTKSLARNDAQFFVFTLGVPAPVSWRWREIATDGQRSVIGCNCWRISADAYRPRNIVLKAGVGSIQRCRFHSGHSATDVRAGISHAGKQSGTCTLRTRWRRSFTARI